VVIADTKDRYAAMHHPDDSSSLMIPKNRKQSAYMAFASRILSQDSFGGDMAALEGLASALDMNELSVAISKG